MTKLVVLISASLLGMTADAQYVVDGSKQPELISDFAAYEVFLQMLSLPRDAEPSQIVAVVQKIDRAHLSPEDTALLLQHLVTFNEKLAAVQGRFHELHSKSASSQMASSDVTTAQRRLDQEYRQLVKESVHKIKSALTPDGVSKVSAYVQNMKTSIKRTCPDKPCPTPAVDTID